MQSVKFVLVLVFILFTGFSFSQNSKYYVNGELLLGIKPERIPSIDTSKKSKNVVILAMPFAEAKFVKNELSKKLRNKIITEVELYYSSYKLADDFSQPKLNQSRFDTLLKFIPSLKRNSFVKWTIFEQTAGKNEIQAKKLFHGFIIKYKLPPTEASAKAEMDKFLMVLKFDSLGRYENIIATKPKVKKKPAQKKYEPVLKSKREKNILYDEKGVFNRKTKLIEETPETTYVKKIVGRKFIPPVGFSADIPPHVLKYISKEFDSTVFKILKKLIPDEKTLMVIDVTGSMTPYLIQIVMWNRFNFENVKTKYYVFFNDGDAKKDNQKKIGNTGGIYTVRCDSVIDMEKNMLYAMKKGFGGDIPENNIEAIISGLKKFPQCNRVVMLSDNYASVRDLELVKKIAVPVDIILCGAEQARPNSEYLSIAMATKGRVYTMNETVSEMHKLKDGELLKFMGFSYRISKGNVLPWF